MEFTFDTVYNSAALTAMARALRKTLRKKSSRRSHIFGLIVLALVLVLSIANGFAVTFKNIVTWLAGAAILIALIWEDRLNGHFAGRKMMAEMKRSMTTFTDEGYHSHTELGDSDFPYDKIKAVAETRDYFVLMYSRNHAQVYDKRGLEGNANAFRKFIEERTGCSIEYVK